MPNNAQNSMPNNSQSEKVASNNLESYTIAKLASPKYYDT
jgi:hypothetical protein